MGRLLPRRAAFRGFACRQRHIHVTFCSCRQNGVHNVQGSSSRLCREELDLSNTSESWKTLSFSKPPHHRSSFAAFQHVLDRKTAPGKGGRRNPSGFRRHCSSRSWKEPDPVSFRGPVPIQHPLPGSLIPVTILYKLLLFRAGNRLKEPVRSRFLSITAGTGSFLNNSRNLLFASILWAPQA